MNLRYEVYEKDGVCFVEDSLVEGYVFQKNCFRGKTDLKGLNFWLWTRKKQIENNPSGIKIKNII